MNKFTAGLLALPMLAIASTANAASVGVTTGEAFIPAGATLEDFTSYTPATPIGTFTPGIGIATTDLAGQHVFPFSVDTGTYAYVSAGESPVTLHLTGDMTYFGMLWGTVDNYNTISFYDGETLVGSFTGTQVLPGATGGVSDVVYANFWAHGGTFDTVVFTSTQEAFEFDNVRVAATPLPAALGLFGSAIVGMGALGLRRRRQA